MAKIGSCGRVRCGKCGSLVGPPLELVASTMRQGSAVPDRTVVVELELSDAARSPRKAAPLVVGHRGQRSIVAGAHRSARQAIHDDRMRRALSPKGQQLLEVMDGIVDGDRKAALLAAARTEADARRVLAEGEAQP